MKLSDLISDLRDVNVKGNTDIEIMGVSYRSKDVQDGYVFVCIEGFKTDGHLFAGDAIKRGASAVIVQKDIDVPDGVTLVKVKDSREALALISAAYFNYPAGKLKFIGVTGTNGKTTTTYLLKSILDRAGYKTALLGTISNIIGDEIINSKNTTPESYDLQEMLARMVEKKMDYCVMEASSHSLELKRVFGIHFNEGIFTNLTRDHLDFHGTFENYLNAKIKLFAQSGTAVINIDDPYGSTILDRIKIPSVNYSEKGNGDVKARNVEITSRYSKFLLEYKDSAVEICLPLPGRFNVYNALSAASACICEGISLEIIKQGLESVKGVSGRSEVVDSGRGYTIIIDYAHTPDGLENIISTVREYAKRRIITVFGCGGDRDKTKRPIMGEVAGKLSDICIVTSDNPRTEDPDSIIADILPGIEKTGVEFKKITDRREAIKTALSIAESDDVVLIAGKGHETYQVLKDRTIQFDEREIVSDILKNEIQLK
jgi:UDP-N-acetylmuramyl-tripeptide synthetase